jgi:4-amino-4-deoxy-L-arabinose transferase-like glycosyltransferase
LQLRPSLISRSHLPFIGLGALLYVVLFWQLGGTTFWDPDEAHYAETSRELIQRGDWIAAYYNQQPFFDKPILFHWLQAAPMALFGASEGAARLVPALAALALVGVTWWLGAVLAGADVGLLAALILASNPGVFGLARYAILDTVFTAFLFGGVALIAVAALANRPRLQYGGYVLIGLATFTKGPVALALCGLAFVLAIILSADARRRLTSLRLIVGLLIVALLSAPWFVMMLIRFGRAFIDGYVLNENLLLFAARLYGNQPHWWFYFGILGLGLLPWTGLIIGRLFDDLRNARRHVRPPDTFEALLWSWVAAIVGFFTVSNFKLDHYVFPAAPALAILCARAWVDARGTEQAGVNRGARSGLRLVGPLLVVIGLAGTVLGIARLDLPIAASVVPASMVLGGAVATFKYTMHPSAAPRVPLLVFAVFAIMYAGAVAWAMPALERGKVVPDVARWVAAHASASDRVATFQLNRWNPAYRFYVNRHTLMLQGDEDARHFFSDPSPYYCVMTRPVYDALRAAGVPLKVVYSREGFWATSGRALWRRKPDLTEFVVTVPASQPLR